MYSRTMDVDEVKNLYYQDGLSAREVGEHLGKTVWQVIKFMRKHNIPRRRAPETQHLQFLRSPLSYQKKTKLNKREQKLYLSGLMLYWAEGVKSSSSTVDFANSDSRMVKLFLKMLRKIYQVNESRLRVLLYCYSNQNKNHLIKYWSKQLKIPKSQFIKPYVRQDYKESKKGKMPYGLVHVRYNDKRLLARVIKDIDIIYSTIV